MPRRLTVKTGQPRYLTTRQSAVRLGVTINAIKAWIREERLPALKTPGGHHRISEPDLLEFHARLAENSRTPVSTRPRILVVDDDPSLLAALRETIEQAIPEAIVAVATAGYAALVQLRAFPPQALLLYTRNTRAVGFHVRLRPMAPT